MQAVRCDDGRQVLRGNWNRVEVSRGSCTFGETCSRFEQHCSSGRFIKSFVLLCDSERRWIVLERQRDDYIDAWPRSSLDCVPALLFATRRFRVRCCSPDKGPPKLLPLCLTPPRVPIEVVSDPYTPRCLCATILGHSPALWQRCPLQARPRGEVGSCPSWREVDLGSEPPELKHKSQYG